MPHDMTANLATPELGSRRKTQLNIAVAAALTALSGWMTIADFSHHGDLLFQTSASGALTVLFVILLFLATLTSSAFPKRWLIATSMLLVCRLSLGFPLNIWLENTAASRVVTVLLLGVSAAYLVRSLRGMMHLENRPWMQLRHSAITLTAGGCIALSSLPILLLGYAQGAKFLIGDYAALSLSGVSVVERVFEKDNQKIHLVGMMHIGDSTFYSELKQRMTTTPATGGKRLILTEGVADRERIIPADFANGKTYERWAKAFNIQAQPALSSKTHPETPSPDHLIPPISADTSTLPAHPHIVFQNADIDVADLNANHKELLVRLLEAASSQELSVMLGSRLGDVTGSQIEDLLKNGLILTRNEVLMQHLDENGNDFSEIYIPWGAAHLPDIEKRLLARGYQLTSETTRPIVKFW
jgi:hypothetical protein